MLQWFSVDQLMYYKSCALLQLASKTDEIGNLVLISLNNLMKQDHENVAWQKMKTIQHSIN